MCSLQPPKESGGTPFGESIVHFELHLSPLNILNHLGEGPLGVPKKIRASVCWKGQLSTGKLVGGLNATFWMNTWKRKSNCSSSPIFGVENKIMKASPSETSYHTPAFTSLTHRKFCFPSMKLRRIPIAQQWPSSPACKREDAWARGRAVGTFEESPSSLLSAAFNPNKQTLSNLILYPSTWIRRTRQYVRKPTIYLIVNPPPNPSKLFVCPSLASHMVCNKPWEQ